MRAGLGLRGAAFRELGRLRWPLRSALVVAFVAFVAFVAAAPASALAAAGTTASSTVLPADTPPPILQGTVAPLSHLGSATGLDVNVGLGMRNSGQLAALITAASTPGNPSYGHYLTKSEYLADYAPTTTQVDAAAAWLAAHGLDVTGVSSDNLLIHVHTTVARAESAFAVRIDNYRASNHSFHANDRAPAVPAGLDISGVTGLSNFNVYKPAITAGGYDGADFRTEYDATGDGSGRTLGFTLWGRALAQSDFDGYATATGTTKLTIGQSGDDGIDFVPVDGSTTESDTDDEVGLDTQVAHTVAPKIHETYYLGHDSSDSTLEDVLHTAAMSSIDIFSDSWGCNGCSIDTNMDNALMAGAGMGKTFFFSTGDSGAAAGVSRPAVSQYTVAVGGTLMPTVGPPYQTETAWSGSGGGCSAGETRPSWQAGIGSPLTWPSAACNGRAIPDVAADGGTNAFTFVDGANLPDAGTSLSTPIWAALGELWDNNNVAHGRPTIGFVAPLIYQLANDPTTYAHDFHDITSGSNGFGAGTGWDEVTGWGTPDFNQLANNLADITYTGPTNANHGETISLSATLLDHGASTPLTGRTISFAAAGESCDATTDGSGHASCNVTINDAPGHYSAIAAVAGDVGYKAVSQTVAFTVNGIATTTRYTGPTSGDYGVPVTLTASLTDDSNSTGIAGETLHISFGAE
ncbi:MAG TPA: protease pro-enzyme activation domain-containing protein, partial [Solirubrobacteraceae bacterium]